MVASAAPFMPICNAKMAIGSRTTFIKQPTKVDSIAKAGEPSARITEFMAVPNI